MDKADKKERTRRSPMAAPYSEPEPKPALSPLEMRNPTPAEESRMRAQVEDERNQRRMDDAYEKAAPRSMRRGFAAGGSVGSASKRADGCAQRGKTKGRMI